jgi:hypothetical protein
MRATLLYGEVKFDPRPSWGDNHYETKIVLDTGDEIQVTERGNMQDISRGDRVAVAEYYDGNQYTYSLLNREEGVLKGPLTDEEVTAFQERGQQHLDTLLSLYDHAREHLSAHHQLGGEAAIEAARAMATSAFIQTHRS